jgi:hypothetical protein
VPARVRLALIVFATLSILGASGVILFAKPEPATRVSADGFAGAVSPSDIAVRDFSLRDQDGKPALPSASTPRTTRATAPSASWSSRA